jgi:dipeptidyl aminopeptidase/acylaminoacyl peptidase
MSNTPVAKRAFSIDDIADLRAVSGVQLSPDGRSAICVVTSVSNNSYQDIITLIDAASGQQKQLTAGSSPQWSPDGKAVAFLGDNNDNAAIFTYNLQEDSGELLMNIYESDYFIDHFVNKNFCWSPDGKTIAYVSAAPVSEGTESPAFREFTHLLYKTKGGRGREIYADQRHTHIWLIGVKEKIARLVFVSEFDEHSICWSPDGKKICFISNTTGNPDMNQWSDVFATDISTGEINKISNERGSAFQPAWSPDGFYIAYLGIKSEISTNDSPAEDTQLYIVPSTGGPAKCLTRSLDRRIEQLSWEPSSQYIYFTAGDKGTTLLYRVSVLSGEIEAIIDIEGKVTEYSISADGKKIIYVHTGTTHLGDVFIYNVADHSHIKLTGFREELCLLQPAEVFWFKSFDDTDVQGWLIRPVHFNESKKYPLILVIHGGPHNMFGYEFEDRMQLLSASGYGVLFMNPRGSSGYGQKFSNGCVKAWGEGDYKDLMQGVEVVLKNNKWIDASRLGVTGQSYGGYMTNRIITKTKRFRAAVADGSICNLISFAGTSLYHSLMESEYQDSVYDNYEALWRCSPLRDVKNVSTPVLFLHGETDNEVPFSQAEEMFIAVKKLGVETALVQYIGEGHGWRPDLLPDSRKDLLQRMIHWFNKYV